MIQRKRYLYTSSVIPRRTLYRQRLRERQQQALIAPNQRDKNATESDQQTSNVERNIQTATSSPEEPHNETLTRTDSGIADARSSGEEDSSEHAGMSSDYDDSDSEDDLAADGAHSLSHQHQGESDDLGNESEEEEDDEREEDNALNVENTLCSPLCKCTTTTEGDAMLMCLALGLRHNLSWAAIVDTMSMINHLFDREVVKASKYFFEKYMEAGKGKIICHMYCLYCERYLGIKEDLVANQFLTCQCGTEMKHINHASNYFLSISLHEQIKTLLTDDKFVNGLSYRFTRKKNNEDSFDDIFDGEVYRNLSGPNQVLSQKYNFSYCFNTDGFPVGGKSGRQSCWPIYIQFLELEPKLRSKYMLLAGIYVGKKDPNMKIFMHSFVEEANVLSSVGIDWTLNGKSISSKVIPLCACVDSPAMAKLLNMTQFTGWFGCTLCHCKAESTENGLRYTVPFNGLRERTHEEILVNAAQAHANSRTRQNRKRISVQGVKGLTNVHTMFYLDLFKGVRPDTMHSKLIGNAHHHTCLLHDSTGRDFYIGSDCYPLNRHSL